MKAFFFICLLVILSSYQSVRGMAVDDTVKNRFSDLGLIYDQSVDYTSTINEGIRLIVNDSVQEGISHLADGLNTLKLKEKSDRIYNYHITELVSFISNLNNGSLAGYEQELGELVVKALFKNPDRSLFRTIDKYLRKYPNSIFINRINVFISSFFMKSDDLKVRLNKLLALDSLQVSAITLMAEVLYRDEQYAESIRYFSKAIELFPEYSYAWDSRGLCYGKLGQYENAIRDHGSAIEQFPGYVPAYNNRGNARQELKQYEASITDYHKAIEINPDFDWPYNNLALSFEYLNKKDSAFYFFDMAIFKNGYNAVFYDNRGDLYYDRNEYEKAIMDYSRAIDLAPANENYYVDRGDAYYYWDEVDAALPDFEKAIEIAPGYNYALTRISDCHYKKGNFLQSITYCKKVIEKNPEYKYAYIRMGLSYGQLGDHLLEIETFRKAVEIDSTYESALGNLGWAYYCVDNYDSCIYFSAKAVQHDENAFYAMFNIALSKLRQGKFDESKVLYREYLDLYHKAEGVDAEISGGPEGAIQDLKDLLEKGIMVNEVNYILKNLFVR